MNPRTAHTPTTKDQRFNIRATAEVKALVEQAASASHMTSSEFVLQAVVRSAEEILGDQTRFVLPAEEWARFTALLDRPAREIPALKQAASRQSPLGEC